MTSRLGATPVTPIATVQGEASFGDWRIPGGIDGAVVGYAWLYSLHVRTALARGKLDA